MSTPPVPVEPWGEPMTAVTKAIRCPRCSGPVVIIEPNKSDRKTIALQVRCLPCDLRIELPIGD